MFSFVQRVWGSCVSASVLEHVTSPERMSPTELATAIENGDAAAQKVGMCKIIDGSVEGEAAEIILSAFDRCTSPSLTSETQQTLMRDQSTEHLRFLQTQRPGLVPIFDKFFVEHSCRDKLVASRSASQNLAPLPMNDTDDIVNFVLAPLNSLSPGYVRGLVMIVERISQNASASRPEERHRNMPNGIDALSESFLILTESTHPKAQEFAERLRQFKEATTQVSFNRESFQSELMQLQNEMDDAVEAGHINNAEYLAASDINKVLHNYDPTASATLSRLMSAADRDHINNILHSLMINRRAEFFNEPTIQQPDPRDRLDTPRLRAQDFMSDQAIMR